MSHHLVRMLPALWVLTMLAAACGGDEPLPLPTATPTPEQTVEPVPEPTAEPTPTPTPTPTLAPLTGEERKDAEDLDRPVFAVKLDNNRAALPQDGLELADIVFTELVEGGATRFVALFHANDPGEVGPIRSARDVDMELLPPFTPVFGYSGANEGTLADLLRSGLLLTTDDESGWFRRPRPGVAYEHTLYTSVAEQWQRGARLPAPQEPWPFSPDADGGVPVDGMTFTYSPETTLSWSWDGAAFVREQYGAPHLTESGKQVTAANVVAARVEVRPSPRGSGTVTIDVVGEGEATVFRDGRAIEARWRKTSPDTHFAWLTADGDPLPLAPGRTWIELVPTRGDVTVVTSAGGLQPGTSELPSLTESQSDADDQR